MCEFENHAPQDFSWQLNTVCADYSSLGEFWGALESELCPEPDKHDPN